MAAQITESRERLEQPEISLPRYLLKEQLSFAVLVWLAFVAVVLAIILAVAYWRGIEVSGWDQASGVAQWYGVFIGVYVGWSVLPLHLTHGQTRREFMLQAMMFTVIFAAFVSVLVTVTFVAEAGLYRLAGWTQAVDDGRLYGGALELHLIFLQAMLLLTLWTAGGLFISAAWYRSDGAGGLALTAAIVFAGISGTVLEPSAGPLGAVAERLSGLASLPLVLIVGVHFLLIGAVFALTWLAVRDVAVRSKNA